MCGISGVIHLDGGRVEEAEVHPMVAAQKHRGPDAAAVHRVSESIVFGHNRLAIFDVNPRANQPMCFGKAAITYNGEVYNFQELRSSMSAADSLETEGDTEVVLRHLSELGPAAVADFDGFFAFAFFDGSVVHLVRDRFGQKPLYYLEHNRKLYFASEIKALPLQGRTVTLDTTVINHVERYRFSPTLSPFCEVKMLAPGHSLTVDPEGGECVTNCFYDVRTKIQVQARELPESEILERAEILFLESVRKRLASDVPVGVLCSGGLDSSLIAWAARQHAPVELFHVSVHGNSELLYAEEVADALDCPLHVVSWDKEQHRATSAKAIAAFEYADVHPNNTALLAVAALAAARGVKVLLGGEGADELYGGYVHHQRYFTMSLIERFAGRFLSGLLSCSKTPAARWKQHTRGPDRQEEREIEQSVSELAGLYKEYGHDKYLAFLLSDFLSYLQPLLLRGDKMTMASGVELRLPFMDRAFVEWSLGVPASFRVKKALLKKIGKGRLPESILERGKEGFAFPATYFGTENGQEQERIRNSLYDLQRIFSEGDGTILTHHN